MPTAKINNLIDLLNEKGGSAYFGEPVPFWNTASRRLIPPNWPPPARLQFLPRCCTTSATCCTGSTRKSPTAATTACMKRLRPGISPVGLETR